MACSPAQLTGELNRPSENAVASSTQKPTDSSPGLTLNQSHSETQSTATSKPSAMLKTPNPTDGSKEHSKKESKIKKKVTKYKKKVKLDPQLEKKERTESKICQAVIEQLRAYLTDETLVVEKRKYSLTELRDLVQTLAKHLGGCAYFPEGKSSHSVSFSVTDHGTAQSSHNPTQSVVEVRSLGGINYQLEYKRCHRPGCRTCDQGAGHGPYWKAYFWQPPTKTQKGKMVSIYIGKNFKRLHLVPFEIAHPVSPTLSTGPSHRTSPPI